MPCISSLIDLFALSPVPISAQISPYTREFRAYPRRIANVRDSLAERVEFELSVPICDKKFKGNGSIRKKKCLIAAKDRLLRTQILPA